MVLNFFMKELKGDTLTPIAILQKLGGAKRFLLESSLKHSESGRFSFIGANPIMEFTSTGDQNFIIKKSKPKRQIKGNPLEVLKTLLPNSVEVDLPFPFLGGAIGSIGYDIIRQFEEIGTIPNDELQMPDIHLMFFDEVIVYDHLEEKIFVIAISLLENVCQTELEQRVMKRIEELQKPFLYQEETEPFEFAGFIPEISREQFIQNVKTAKKHIVEGDIFQIVLSQRLKSAFSGSPLYFYRNHRSKNPTPYMFFIDFENYSVIGSSPESLVKTRGKKVTANPIAGTIKRGHTIDEDIQLEMELLEDEKELAEHKMLVDLGRNDLGRVCQFGTVKVDKFMKAEKFRHVIHLVSEISGDLKENKSALDALTACIPAGTVSGAPKIRAMEIINKLEGVKRGFYSGAVGYFSINGNMDFALAIRTMIIKDGIAYIQAGAGLVYDSKPELEYAETMNKLKSFLEGVNHDITY